ncbi:UNVERIFIED_CONTAM: hypothetical protein NCL1_07847 [Trichonephila clavipes]
MFLCNCSQDNEAKKQRKKLSPLLIARRHSLYNWIKKSHILHPPLCLPAHIFLLGDILFSNASGLSSKCEWSFGFDLGLLLGAIFEFDSEAVEISLLLHLARCRPIVDKFTVSLISLHIVNYYCFSY